MDSEATADDAGGPARAPSQAAAVSNPPGSLLHGSIGAVLGAARIERGLDLVDIARDTRVPVRHLAAIEADDHDHLPALPYAIGFVKAFARAVGVDADMAGARFRAETSKAAHVPLPPAMAPTDARRLPPRGLVAASLAALVAVVALVVAWSSGAFDRAPAPVAAVATAAAPTPAPAVTAAGVAAPAGEGSTAAPAPTPPVAATAAGVPPPATGGVAAPAASGVAAPAAGGVVITAREDAWFKVSVFDPAAGKVVTIKTGVLAKGERYAPPPTPGLRLWTGRAGALAITVDGAAVPPLGKPVETIKNVSLDPADLRARIATGPAAGPLPGRAGPPVG